MSITNPNGKTNLFGFSIPNLLLYLILGLVLFFAFKIGSIFSALFEKIKKALGLNTEDSKEENLNEIAKSYSKDPAVQSQMTTGNKQKAEALFNAMDGFTYDIDAIYEIFFGITGPSQLKAVSLAFGTRTVGPMLINKTGDLATCVKARLWDYQYTKKLKLDSPSIKERIDAWLLNSK